MKFSSDKEKTLTLDGREYKIDTLSPDALLFLNHLRDIQKKLDRMTIDMQQLKIAQESFIHKLKDEVKKDNIPYYQ